MPEKNTDAGDTVPDSAQPPGDLPPAPPPTPVVLCDTQTLAEALPAPAGALWKLSESGRQLDANLIHLPPSRRVDTHTEPDLDVLLLVVAGSGTVDSTDGPHTLAAGSLLWLPHGCRRSVTADAAGLSYLTVHQRRPGMQIRRRAARG
jgi:quercetin dioxygenase-like cupin family protein